jgi:hypothetical protein
VTKSEGEQLLGSAKGQVRVYYSRTGRIPQSLSEVEPLEAYEGQYYRVHETVKQLPDGRVQLKAVSQTGTLEVGIHTFELEGGSGTFEWHDTDPD